MRKACRRRSGSCLGSRFQHGVVRVAGGAVGVDGGLVDLVQRVVLLPAAGQVRVGDHRAADDDGVGQSYGCRLLACSSKARFRRH